MLELEHARREARGIVVVAHRHGPLRDDRAVIDVVGDEMDGAAVDAHAVGERATMRVEPG